MTIAAAILASPALCWGQISIPGPGVPKAEPVTAAEGPRVDTAVRPAAAELPAPAPPSIEGAWVADDQAPPPRTMPNAMAPGYGRPMPPGGYYPMARANIYGDPSMGPPAGAFGPMGPAPGGMGPMGPPPTPPGQGYGPPPRAGNPNMDGNPGPEPPAEQQGANCNDQGMFPPGDIVGSWVDWCVGSCFKPMNTDLWTEVHCHHRVYGSIDTLLWWVRGNPTPPLVTTSPLGTPQTAAGVLGQPNTSILFGNEQIDTSVRSGGRINLGYWLVDGEFWGIEGHYLALGTGGTDYSRADNFTTGPGGQILARPFFNTQTGMQDSALVAFPNFNLGNQVVNLDGSVNVRSTSNVQSAGVLLRHLLWIDFQSQYRVDLVGGYRFFRADDSVTINDEFVTQGGVLAPTTFRSNDVFSAVNIFNGGEIGLSGQFRLGGRLSISTLWKIALGDVHQRVTINGVNSISTLGTTISTPGGLLTQPTNIGRYGRDQFGILPEMQLNLRYDLSSNWRALFGYTFIYLDKTQRSGSAIDTTLNPTQINGGTLVGAARPAFAFRGSDFWAQGINFGLEYRW